MSAGAALLDGEPAFGEWPQSRALQYGDGVFRTLLVWRGKVVDGDAQLRKLAADATRLDLDAPSKESLESDFGQLLESVDCGVLKIILGRRGGSRGYAPQTRAVQRLTSFGPLPQYGAACWSQGVRVEDATLRLSRQPYLAGIKHLNRLEQVLASRAWLPGQHEALMCDDSGYAISGTRSNLFIAGNGILRTPRLTRCGIAGLMRDKLLQLAAANGLVCEEDDIRREELDRCDECFLTNSLIGLWPVRSLAQRQFAAPGPITTRLAALLNHPWRG